MSRTTQTRKREMKFWGLESLAYRKAFWGKHCKICVSPQDRRDIRAAEVIMQRMATTTTDQTKVPWYIDERPQHRPWYSGKKNKDNEYICQLID